MYGPILSKEPKEGLEFIYGYNGYRKFLARGAVIYFFVLEGIFMGVWSSFLPGFHIYQYMNNFCNLQDLIILVNILIKISSPIWGFQILS